MIKRRYGIINKKGILKVKTDNYMKNTFLLSCYDINSREKRNDKINKFIDAYNGAFDYSVDLKGNVAIGLKNNKKLCVWEMGNKETTYKEFII